MGATIVTKVATPALQPSLPSSAYTDPAHFAREQTHIFAVEWMVACRTEEVSKPGDWLVMDMSGDDILVVRDKHNTLRAFFNVCRHRGARLCAAAGEPAKPGRATLPSSVLSNGFIRCPYHGWTYDAEGRLIGAPHLAEGPGFRHADFSLYPVGCAEWGGFVFLHTNPTEAASLPGQLDLVPARLANYPLADLRIGHRITYSVDANWKIL
jgi:Rieske 2Fe-2S family protein